MNPHPYSLLPTASASCRRPWGSSDLTILPRRDVYGPEGTLAQVTVPHLPSMPDIDADVGGGIYSSELPSGEKVSSSHASKKAKQWSTWANDVIPSLLHPYLGFLHESKSLRNAIPESSVVKCKCPSHVRKLNVTCVYFEC